MRLCNSGGKSSLKRGLMAISLTRIMDTISDICLVKKEKETITNLGTARKSSDNKHLEKASTTDALSRRSVTTT